VTGPVPGLISSLFTRGATLSNIDQEFIKRDAKYIEKRTEQSARYKKLVKKFDELKKHSPMACSAQHALEAKWLINYSDKWDVVGDALNLFEQSLKVTDQPRFDKQDAQGSWGPCCEKWYRKLEPTVDALQEDQYKHQTLNPLLFMQDLQDIDTVRTTLELLSVSDIAATGWNNRDEYGAWLTALSQLTFKQTVRDVLAVHTELEFDMPESYIEAYRAHLRHLQHDSGYWGPAYMFNGKKVDVQDLSFTFHIVHYYMQDPPDGRPNLPNLDKIAATTLEIRDKTYPNGWLTKDGAFDDHNNYDVVTLFKHCWDHTPGDLQKKIAPEIQALSDWCLTRSFRGDHFGDAEPASPDDYYYGVRFLDTIGLWNTDKTFWRSGPIPLPNNLTAEGVRDGLRKGFAKVRNNSEYSETIARILGV
jgi:hypothetical protein